jgi:hypothetical protein
LSQPVRIVGGAPAADVPDGGATALLAAEARELDWSVHENPRGENFDAVARVLAGTHDGVRRLAAEPGTLTLFRGHHSLPRVTPGFGPSKRLLAALSYVREPDATFSAYARTLFHGRGAARPVAARNSGSFDDPDFSQA